MDKYSKIYIAGHTGLVGSAIYQELVNRGYENLILCQHHEYDLSNSEETRALFDKYKPEYVFMAAAFAGGIRRAIDSPSQMLVENMLIIANVIKRAYLNKVKKLIFLGSSCIYPVDGQQPYIEAQIGTGKTDENWGYAIAKIAGIELCHAYHKQYGKNFLSVVPCNIYGPNDNFKGRYSHVIPALIKKVAQAEGDTVEIWGDGKSKREFLYSGDLAEICVDIMEKVDYEHIAGVVNVGSGIEVTIDHVFDTIKHIMNKGVKPVYTGSNSGVPSKLMDCSRLHSVTYWKPKTPLFEGIRKAYDSYCSHH